MADHKKRVKTAVTVTLVNGESNTLTNKSCELSAWFTDDSALLITRQKFENGADVVVQYPVGQVVAVENIYEEI